MLSPKKNSYKEFENQKNFCGSKSTLPPIAFLMVRPLTLMKKKKIRGTPKTYLGEIKVTKPFLVYFL